MPTENATQPQDAGIRIRSARRPAQQQMQVGSRLIEPIIKLSVGRFNQGDVFAVILVSDLYLVESLFKTFVIHPLLFGETAHFEIQAGLLLRLQLHPETGRSGGDFLGWNAEMNLG